MNTDNLALASQGNRAPQRGVVLLFSLIALVIMLVAGVALMRSFNTSLFNAGNIAFKRDLLNQGERALPSVVSLLSTGGPLGTEASRQSNVPANNYRATMLPDNAQGIPDALFLKDTEFFANYGNSANEIKLEDQQVRVRYLIDRLCNIAGIDSTIMETNCVLSKNDAPDGGSADNMKSAQYASGSGQDAIPSSVVYRISIRVDGPRSTQAFFQSTYSLGSD